MRKLAILSILSLGLGVGIAGQASARDTTPPVITPTVTGTLGTNGWFTSDVGLIWTVTDPESTSIKKSGCGTVSRTTDTSGTTYTCKATSAGGTSTRSVTIQRDATKPVVTITTPPSSATYNVGTTVTPSFTCIDATSGVPSGACTVTTPIDTATAGDKRFVVTATDRAGNLQSSTVYYKVVDLTPPVINATVTPTANANGWHKGDVSVRWSVTDPESAFTVNGCVQVSITSDTSAAGTTYPCSATSLGGSSSKPVTIKRDTAPPIVTITRPAFGASYTLNQPVTASFSCSDVLSGLASCKGTVDDGIAIDTSTTGDKTFTVIAYDLAGNTTTRTTSYKVTGSTSSGTGGTRLFAWNDLGMHCMDTDYSVFTLLPPFNTLTAQLMVNGKLVNDDVTSGKYTLEYAAMKDGAGSINSSHLTNGGQDKTNFWDKFTAMFGFAGPPAGVGLLQFPTPTMNWAAMDWNGTTSADADGAGHYGFKWYEATGIPVTPIDDGGNVNPFPMVQVRARDSATGKVVAMSTSVLPVSTEMNCVQCHAGGTGTVGAKPDGGWFTDAGYSDEQKWRINALRKHDERFKDNATFIALMAPKGFVGNTLEYSATHGKPIFCDACHNSNALAYWGLGGDASVSQITTAMHKAHSTAKLPGSSLTLDEDKTREACYSCHPGKNTQCLRGAMGNPTDPLTKQHTMECQSCHGSMKVVGTAKMGDLVGGSITNLRDRRPWFDMPTCQSCHQDGQRYTTALTVDTVNNTFAYRASTDPRFATNPNTPNLLAGLSMYRFSVDDHGKLQCAACHNSTHAEFTSKTAANSANDDLRAIEAQGYAAAIRECTACHATVPKSAKGGPHGMHYVGQAWVTDHHDVVTSSNKGDCLYCHGSTAAGSGLAVIKTAKTFNIDDGRTKSYSPSPVTTDVKVTCWDCHNGPMR